MENETFENITFEETNQDNSENIEENVENTENDVVSATYDYPYSYYNDVINHLDTIKTNQETLLQKQDVIIAFGQQRNTDFKLISVLLGIVICYMFIKSILNLK